MKQFNDVILPVNPYTCWRVVGDPRSMMALIFFRIGLNPSLMFHEPKKLSYYYPEGTFSRIQSHLFLSYYLEGLA